MLKEYKVLLKSFQFPHKKQAKQITHLYQGKKVKTDLDRLK